MRFVPSEFEVPDLLEHDRFRLPPLTVHDLVKDYDAVMSPRDYLWDQFGQAWGWPRADLALEQDLIDLGWHQKEFQRRSSFAYAVMSPDETRLLGCVYVDPPRRRATTPRCGCGCGPASSAPAWRPSCTRRCAAGSRSAGPSKGRLPRPGAWGARRREVIQDDAETGPVGLEDLGVAGGCRSRPPAHGRLDQGPALRVIRPSSVSSEQTRDRVKCESGEVW